MKSIQTTWKGYRFRSRTEARWAVFFDTAGILFEYEPEGFVLPSGPYLPDFRLRLFVGSASNLREHHIFIEVKGETPDQLAIDRVEQLDAAVSASRSGGGASTFVAVGAPDTTFSLLPIVPPEINPAKVLRDEACRFVGNDEGCLGVELQCQPGHLNYLGYRTPEERSGARNFRVQAEFPTWLRKAYDAARGARFEFGETDDRWGP